MQGPLWSGLAVGERDRGQLQIQGRVGIYSQGGCGSVDGKLLRRNSRGKGGGGGGWLNGPSRILVEIRRYRDPQGSLKLKAMLGNRFRGT